MSTIPHHQNSDWYSAADMARLMGISHQRFNQIVAERGWRSPANLRCTGHPTGIWRRENGKILYHYSLLPALVRARLAAGTQLATPTDDRKAVKQRLARDQLWALYEKASDKTRDRARRKLAALQAVHTCVQSGMAKDASVRMIGQEQGFSAASYYGWETRVAGIDRADWLPYLLDRYTGRVADPESCSDEAWEFIKADYLRPEARAFEVCYRTLAHVATQKGWTIPSSRTLLRRLEREIPVVVRVLKREGLDALKRLFPAQERDRSMFHALEAVNVDGHTFDVFVAFPDGSIGRPCLVGFQDLYSGLILSWRVDRSETKELVRLAIGDMVRRWGIPDHCWLDNGRAFASKWITGGIANRYRFKVKEEEPSGLLTDLGVAVHWTTPYHGQAKPIERAWRDFCNNIAKDPRLAGAYTGNNPTAKPENYASRAVPLDDFLKVVAWGIHEHNNRPGRDTKVCGRRLSFQAAFEASYAQAPIRKATPQQHRLWLLAAEGVKARDRDGAVHIEGNRYWAEFLTQHRGTKLVARFDPQDLHGEVHLYSLSGSYLGAAPCVEAAGFADIAAARAHAAKRNAWLKAVKQTAKAELAMSIEEVAALLPEAPEAPPPPAPGIIRPVFGNNALKPAVPVPVADSDPEADVLASFSRAVARMRLVERE
ncbi:DDE-type integrase/transposase/recombinase [Niveispirillum sp. SYP-B3756]|uniref:transposase domain-containing protein n=1 Tax=Niveispirillum sp. SYP-B3756 TaxID=2662178 RepID=UPI0012917BA3|nr:transposase domain-containing protein [Niveispirillum sp. SYP-B3756]MQP67501.1 DDE-type integrase/transposase/recombinase [Niveispirillum sp. SYP-B3756]